MVFGSANLTFVAEENFLMLNNVSQSIVAFLRKEDGPTSVEYALMLSLIVVVCFAAVTTLGSNAKTTYTTVGTKLAAS